MSRMVVPAMMLSSHRVGLKAVAEVARPRTAKARKMRAETIIVFVILKARALGNSENNECFALQGLLVPHFKRFFPLRGREAVGAT